MRQEAYLLPHAAAVNCLRGYDGGGRFPAASVPDPNAVVGPGWGYGPCELEPAVAMVTTLSHIRIRVPGTVLRIRSVAAESLGCRGRYHRAPRSSRISSPAGGETAGLGSPAHYLRPTCSLRPPPPA
ncbi:hypothetical protein SKAU_G00158110 [Synaphobranchus kaupii]|uniref:Uncharacterized protein n=1 Tax=Synaphobranchus kaupii TaxID=118154 RepID=A0A9Q1FI43_SYNKA|nr:hypothetical protein SKAU_G00158110 [Synaphobranchus kaupii]